MKKIFLLFFTFFAFNSVAFSNVDYLYTGDYKTAYIEFNERLNKVKNPENYLNMCKVTYYLGDDDNAKSYCKSALNLIELQENPDSELKSEILMMMGNVYSMAYHNVDLPFEYYNYAKKLKEENPNTDKFNLAKLYTSMGFTYNYLGNKILADEYLNKALFIVENLEDKKSKVIAAAIYNEFSVNERKSKNYIKSKEYLDKGLESSVDADVYENPMIKAALYKNLAKHYKYEKKDKKTAIVYYQKAVSELAKFPENTMLKTLELYESTKDELEHKLKEYPYDINSNIELAKIYLSEDKFFVSEKSRKIFNNVISLNPQNPYLYIFVAEAFASEFKNTKNKIFSKEAKKYIKLANKYAFYEPSVYFKLGLISLDIDAIRSSKKYFNLHVRYSNGKDAEKQVNNINQKNL